MLDAGAPLGSHRLGRWLRVTFGYFSCSAAYFPTSSTERLEVAPDGFHFAGILRFNVNLGRLNLALLFFIAMLPGPTSVLSEYGDDPTPWPSVLYAANIAAVYLTMAAIWGYARHADLMDPDTAVHRYRKVFNARVAGALVFLASIPAAFALNAWTPFLWLLLVPVSLLTRRFSA
jgi:uncharacterized membrane protein